MIIGNGTIASVLKDNEKFLYFASGVSNSLGMRKSEYEREKKLLLAQDKYKHVVYFSTLAVFYGDSLYVQHKRRMEKLVRENFKNYCIVRLGHPVWSKKPWHLIPFIKNKIKNKEAFKIEDVYRYPLKLDEFLYWVNLIPAWSCEMNIPGTRMKVANIVKKYRRS